MDLLAKVSCLCYLKVGLQSVEIVRKPEIVNETAIKN